MAAEPDIAESQAVDELKRQLAATLERQTAMSEILRAISQSPTDVQPVLDAIAASARRFCGADNAGVILREESEMRVTAHDGPLPAALGLRVPLDRSTGMGRSISDGRTVHIPDVLALDPAEFARGQELARTLGFRAVLAVPMLGEGQAIGALLLRRSEPGEFTQQQIELLETFAAQAVIAIENVRLFTELKESLEQQTATAEVLRVISQSPTDVQPVLKAVVAAARRFCGAEDADITLREGSEMVMAAHAGGKITSEPKGTRTPLDRTTIRGRSIMDAATVHIPDVLALNPTEYGLGQHLARTLGFRAVLSAPMLRDDGAIGCITLPKADPVAFTQRQVELLETFAAQAVIAIENVRLFTELRESLERQTATAEVLQVISSSPGNLAPVFDAMLEKATELCEAKFGCLFLYDGKAFTVVADRNLPPAYAQMVRGQAFSADANSVLRHMVENKVPVHVADMFAGAAYAKREPLRMTTIELGGVRSLIAIPLLNKGELIGSFAIYRDETGGFREDQIALVATFANQAVIAIENARLLDDIRRNSAELARSVDELTATGDVLKIISRSSVNLDTVLDTLVETVARLCRADLAYMFRQKDEVYHLVAAHGLSDDARVFVETHPLLPDDRATISGRVNLERRTVHISDVLQDPEYNYEGQRTAGYRTMLGVPLLREDMLIGIFIVGRTRVEPFADKEIELATSFADQAVIAIENARLFEELRERQAELRVTFDNMGDGVAMFDAEPRLAAWNRNFEQIIGLSEAQLVERPSYADYLRLLAERGEFGTENVEAELASRLENTHRELRLERTRADGTVIEVRRNAVPGGGFVLIYSDITERRRAEAEIRTARDAAEAALERQTATADILKVIASSPTNVQPVLEAVAEAAVRFCGATDANIHMREGQVTISAAHQGPLRAAPGGRRPVDRQTAVGIAILERRTVQFPDIEALDPVEFAYARQLAAEFGFRAVLAAPLLREGMAIGAITLRRTEPGSFTQQQTELLETFAAQAVIAIENVRLFTELRDSLERLRAAQANLIQAEKMASLGQLTAGIAHEIKNPLNFVNNFAGLSVELLGELKEIAEPVLAGMSEGARADFGETIELITSNLDKITEHGKRADGIVKSMLSHSRGGTGDWQESNINALVEEALNLAYHGARAQDKEFNVTLERDLALGTQPIELVPQDVTRVFLNLFGNGFYAANKRRRNGAEAGYQPTLKVSTRDLGEAVEIRVRDNGTGIPQDVLAKLFQPFFTTKPTGEGTGLGLSISYDIVTQQHGGSIDVESEPGSFTEFTVRLPRRRRVA